IDVATSVAVPPPIPMMPCTRPARSSSSTIAAAPRIWLLVAVARSLRHFSRTPSIGSPPRAATSSVRMSPANAGGSSMLKSSRIGSWPRAAIRSFTKTMSSPRVSRLQTITMPFFIAARPPGLFSLSRSLLLDLGTRQAADHVGDRARTDEAVVVPAVRHLLQHRPVHEDLLRLALPLVRRARVEDDAAGDVARLDRQPRIERRRAAAVDDLCRALGIEARRQRPPDPVHVVRLDVVVDDDHALDAVVAGRAGDHRVADVVRVPGVHLLDRHH